MERRGRDARRSPLGLPACPADDPGSFLEPSNCPPISAADEPLSDLLACGVAVVTGGDDSFPEGPLKVSTSMITATARHEGGSPTIARDTIERATAQAARAAAERVALEAMGLSPVGARLFQELRRHDWGHDDGDDDARVARGRAQAKELRRLYLARDRDEADRVWQAPAPDGVAPPLRHSRTHRPESSKRNS
jgi:hypothetical protein